MSQSIPNGNTRPTPCLPGLGVWGFDEQEPVILAALVTEDPLLLIGPSGTGKTYLLNTLSEALGLEHRHYNASLISFDDLVGFPFPEAETGAVKFLETPATVWGAESVLIDEISRCKPEHQNRLFSLIHERRLQCIESHLLILRMRPALCRSNVDGVQIDAMPISEPQNQRLSGNFEPPISLIVINDAPPLGALQKDKLRLAAAIVEMPFVNTSKQPSFAIEIDCRRQPNEHVLTGRL